MRNSHTLALVFASAAALALTGCAGGASTPDSEGSANSSGAEYGLPAGIDSITVGTSVGTAPYEFYEGNSTEVLGYEPDLLNEVARRLGITVTWQTSDFSALFTGIDAGRLDMAANGIIDRTSRQEHYDILDYITDASGILGATGSTADIETLDDLCGTKIATLSGSSFEEFFAGQSDTCAAEGKEAIELTLFKDSAGATLAVSSGRADYAVSQIPLLTYTASQTDGLEVGGIQFLEGLVGFVFPKDSELLTPMQKVLDEMIADGTYQELLEKWDLLSLAIDEAQVNAGTLE